MAALDAERAGAGIAAASLAVGYPYADIGNLGMSTLVYGENAAVAEAAADRLAEALWSCRAGFRADVVPPAAATARAIALSATARPVVLVDVADNVGGGSPGDGTVLLAELIAQNAPSAAVVLADPEAVRAAAAVGVGGRFVGPVGGKADDLHGAPVIVDGVVRAVREVSYVREEEWMTGQLARQGLSARVSMGGIEIVLTENRTLPYDRRHLTVMGVEPSRTGILVAKAAAGWRTPFEPIMAEAIYCDTPGANAPNLAHFPYTRRPRPLYPLEPGAEWRPCS
jgi:microcystin degradation protein MlrC